MTSKYNDDRSRAVKLHLSIMSCLESVSKTGLVLVSRPRCLAEQLACLISRSHLDVASTSKTQVVLVSKPYRLADFVSASWYSNDQNWEDMHGLARLARIV